MAYCASCGAYIPDGQSKCLACGYDENEQKQEQQAAGASQTAARKQAFDQEELHRKLEEQRRRQQEENRKWAEQEQARRQRQEADRQWAQEEYRRRQQEQQDAQRETSRVNFAGTGAAQSKGNRALAVLSYFSVLFALPYIFTPQDEYSMYHAKQGLRLFLCSLAMDIVGSLFSIGWLAQLLRIYMIFKGVSNASEGKMEPLPYIGTWDPRKK